MLAETLPAGQWLPLHSFIHLDHLGTGLFLEAFNVFLGDQPHLDEAVTGIDERIARLLGLGDLGTLPIRIDVGAAGVRIEQADL